METQDEDFGDLDLILFEDAAFLALFRILAKPSAEEDVTDHFRFASAVKLVGFYQFESINQASECCNDLFEGKLPHSIQQFLENNALDSTTVLGVIHAHLAANIHNELGIKCVTLPAENFIVRGLMMHGIQLVSSLIKKELVEKTRLALAHSFCRRQMLSKDLSTRDNMIIQSSSCLEHADKSSNTFYMRVKEMYGYHFPELITVVDDPVAYIACVRIIGDKKKSIDDPSVRAQLLNIFGDTHEEKVDEILSIANHSVGMELSNVDFEIINKLANFVSKLQLSRVNLKNYVSQCLKSRLPNTQMLLGDTVTASFLTKAGNLANLSKLPSSTLQVLGAEKALFKAIKSRGKTPKYGYIFNTPYITKCSAKFKGKVARLVANKAALCARVDQFHQCTEPVFGEKLKEYLEERVEELEKGITRSVDEQIEQNQKYLNEAVDRANKLIENINETKNEGEAYQEIEDTPSKKQKKEKKYKKSSDEKSKTKEKKSKKSKKSLEANVATAA